MKLPVGKLNYSVEQIHDLAKRTWEVTNFIYNTNFDQLEKRRKVLGLYPLKELERVSKQGDDQFLLVTPKRIFIETHPDKVIIYAVSHEGNNTSNIPLFEICKTDISKECVISTYLNNFFLGLEELTSRHYDDLDLNHERKRAKIIADLISK